MMVMNYAYRHPKLWSMVEKRVDLSKLSRSYSYVITASFDSFSFNCFSCRVEVANLGAWDYPAAPPDADKEDKRLRLDHYGGVVNASFDGVRGLFTLGLITFGNNMSIAVAYDAKSVLEEEANNFVESFTSCVKKMKESEGKLHIKDVTI